MERSPWKRRLRRAILALVVVVPMYFAMTNAAGGLDMPASAATGLRRVEDGFAAMAGWFTDSAAEKNRQMQQVHDDYKTRTDRRIQRHGQSK